jgi:hypothetical protein
LGRRAAGSVEVPGFAFRDGGFLAGLGQKVLGLGEDGYDEEEAGGEDPVNSE